VGGTNLFFGIGGNATPNGAYIGEVVWNDGFGAGGGGISGTFRTPNFQRDRLSKSLVNTFGGHRAYPDVAYNAGVRGGVLVSLSFLPGLPPGSFFIFGGTSASAPQWAGLTSIANQMRGNPVGNINDKVYKLGKKGVLANVLHDVTLGNNSFAGVPGFPATVGFDLSTGWGTPKDGFLQALVGDDDGQD
jgi:subtilase family serine protease